MDTEGAVWYADVGNQRCVRVREGGKVLATLDLDRGAFACALSRGENPRLFVVGQEWGESSEPTGRVVAFPAPAPGAGYP
jgi:sugar lactone lactonase YvrE